MAFKRSAVRSRLSPPKRKTRRESCVSFWVLAVEGGLHPLGLKCSGRRSRPSAKVFTCGKTLERRKSGAAQKGRMLRWAHGWAPPHGRLFCPISGSSFFGGHRRPWRLQIYGTLAPAARRPGGCAGLSTCGEPENIQIAATSHKAGQGLGRNVI